MEVLAELGFYTGDAKLIQNVGSELYSAANTFNKWYNAYSLVNQGQNILQSDIVQHNLRNAFKRPLSKTETSQTKFRRTSSSKVYWRPKTRLAHQANPLSFIPIYKKLRYSY